MGPLSIVVTLLALLSCPSHCLPVENEFKQVVPTFDQTRIDIARDGPNAEELQEWIEGYTENFFAPAFPPEEPDTTLVVQNADTNPLFKKAPELRDLVTATDTDFLEQSDPALNSLEQQVLEKEGHRENVSQALQDFLLENVFSMPRSHRDNQMLYMRAGSYLLSKLGGLGLPVSFQTFEYGFPDAPKDQRIRGVNVVGVLPGRRWGSPEDQVTVIGAHWDTVPGSPGVGDNGSGLAALLEIARLLVEERGVTNNSVIVAAFDKEEEGCEGSRAFVRDFLLPVVVNGHGSKVQGMFNMDTIMSISMEEGSQTVPEIYKEVDPELTNSIESDGNRGDFILTMGRATEGDQRLADIFAKHMTGFRVRHLTIKGLPEKQPSLNVLQDHLDLWRSDHVRFWYHTNYLKTDILEKPVVASQHSFPAILVTDGGYTRGRMAKCYHKACDVWDPDSRSPDSPRFLATVTQAVLESVLEMAEEEIIQEDLVEEKVDEEDVMNKNVTNEDVIKEDVIKKEKEEMMEETTVQSTEESPLSAPKSAQKQVQEISPEPQNPLNFLMSHLSSLGQRQTNYAHVDTQINVENLNLNIGLGEAAFLLEPPSSLTRTVENYYRRAEPETSPMVVRLARDS